MNSHFILSVLWCGLSDVAADVVPVKEGDSVSLNTGVEINQQDIRWYFSDTRIAEINGAQSKICTDVQCPESFKNRLKLDHQTGSLTIRNIRTTDSGEYQLVINEKNSKSEKIFRVTVQGFYSKDGVSVFLSVCGVAADGVSVKEGESVSLHTGVKTNQQDSIKWYFNDTLIAEITGDLSFICTDVQCNEVVPALKLDEMKEGGNVTLYTDVIKNPNDVMTWHFNDILIAGDQKCHHCVMEIIARTLRKVNLSSYQFKELLNCLLNTV
ncbi:uncharacterized protein LOC127988027 [Carassius gibelio]|uniref:uncharacterized protein LOC127988027 n=1 Tax=Carassius gibelio TaxID=101364 RepID=UPI0022780D47|nr:uncharacterized protein LOC127988027 [Carassius gibelio]